MADVILCQRAHRAQRVPLLPQLLLLLVCAVLLLVSGSCSVTLAHAQDEPHLQRQLERNALTLIAHNSFSPPLLRTYYGDDGVPHWQINGATVVTDNYVRLTPDVPRRAGHLWNKETVRMTAFEIIFGFRVHKSPPSSSSSGGEGFAVWLTASIPRYDGALMGHPMQFSGLGVLFDTFDNDRMHDNPNVLLLYNDGGNEKTFTPSRDFRNEYVHSCRFDYRDFTGSSYYTGRLRYNRGTVRFYLSGTDPDKEQLCFTAPKTYLNLPRGRYYIGFTAETSELSAAHDIVFVHTSPLAEDHLEMDFEEIDEEDEVIDSTDPQQQQQQQQQQ